MSMLCRHTCFAFAAISFSSEADSRKNLSLVPLLAGGALRYLCGQATHGLRCGFRIQGLGGFHPVPSYNSNCTKDRSSSTRQPPATLALSSSGIRAGRVPLGVP